MLIFMILAILGVAVMAQWVMRGDRSGASQSVQKTPLMILQERYARGEIQRDEYEEKKRDLGA
ncbi:MAG: SHOCT domain-containing protein [Gammaproteobacteria bacterium]|nr:SHOCT domain-containing protein [Gammaproteobacteria bacterium]